jgi:hypothetical protein
MKYVTFIGGHIVTNLSLMLYEIWSYAQEVQSVHDKHVMRAKCDVVIAMTTKSSVSWEIMPFSEA